MGRIRVGVVGIGKIARDQHIPVLRASSAFELVACASRASHVEGISNFPSVAAMLGQCKEIDAVAICTPPQFHFEAAVASLECGKHVLLEKPPCSTTVQLDVLTRLAVRAGRTLFQSWHSRFAPGVDIARDVLRDRQVRKITIVWKEDVRRWHPGQQWIWQAGGFGVFDPGINAISILTEILPDPVFVTAAELFVPENCQSPIAADVQLQSIAGAEIVAAFDFRHTGDQTWDILVETDRGPVYLAEGGSRLSVDAKDVDLGASQPHAEYAPLYRHFAELIAGGRSDVDGTPFRLVADAFLIGSRVTVEPFHD